MTQYPVLNAVSCERGLLIKDGVWRFEISDVEPKYVIFPSFFNAHTHIGDGFFEALPMPVEDLVGPGGLKHRMLESKGKDEIIESMRRGIEIILKTSSTSLDFREGGIEGYELYRSADREGAIIALSRPKNDEEAEKLVEISPGFNFSSVRDVEFSFLEFCRELAKKHKKIFAIHAGEKDGEDVEKAIALEPDFLIHMNMAEKRQLKMAMDLSIYIVSCMRSNAFFGLLNLENYRILSDYERWLIGTDNVMIASPSMLDEIKFSSYLVPPLKVFHAGTRNPFFESYTVARIERIVDFENPILSVVRRLESCDVVGVINERVVFE